MATNAFATKADFVRSMPDAKPKDIIGAAAAIGIKIPDDYPKRVRYLDRHGSGPPVKPKGRRKRRVKQRRRTGGSPRSLAEIAPEEADEAELRRRIAEVGLTRAREILVEVERRFAVSP